MRVAGGRGGTGGAQQFELVVIFGAAGVMKVLADSGVEHRIEWYIWTRRTKLSNGAPSAGSEPRCKICEWKTRQLRATFPNTLSFAHRGYKRKPFAVTGIIGDDAVAAFEFGEIEIFSVALKWIGLVAIFGQWDGAAGTHNEQGVLQRETIGDAAAAKRKKIAHELRRW